MPLLLLALIADGCIGTSHVGLLPRMQSPDNARNPDLTQPLVPTNPQQLSPERATIWEQDRAPGPHVTLDTAVTAAALLMWLLGGASPLIGVFGTFDENAAFQRPARAPRDVPSRHGAEGSGGGPTDASP